MKRNTRIFFRVLSVIYLLAVAVLCFGKFPPSDEIPTVIFGIGADKIAHCLMFLPMIPLAVISLPAPKIPCGTTVVFIASTLLGVAIGGGSELLQGLTGYRNCDLMDFTADCVGLAIGLTATIITTIIIRKR